jgi:hypothetical protein
MSQQITITIDGKDGRVFPDSVGLLLSSVFSILKMMDRRSWPVDAPRIRWRVSEAKLVNPLTLTAIGEGVISPNNDEPDLAMAFVDYLKQVNQGTRPPGCTDKEIRFLKKIGIEAKKTKSLVIMGARGVQSNTFAVPHSFSRSVKTVARKPPQTRIEYGSVEGTLIRIENDPLKDDGSAKLRERFSGAEISCDADPEKASAMARFVNRRTRIVIYGKITYEDNTPVRVHLEDFASLPSEDLLPTLADIQAMRLQTPDGKPVEDYLDDLRGDE